MSISVELIMQHTNFFSLQMLLELLSCFYLILEIPEGRYEAVL